MWRAAIQYLFRGGNILELMSSYRVKKTKTARRFYDGSLLPFQDNKFDLVLSTQVFEHVKNPFALMRELHRVCKPGGLIILTVPFVFPEHEKPFDFFRFSEHGAKQLYYDNDMVIEYLAKDSNEIDVITTIISLYVVSNLAPKIPGFRRLIALFICFPVQLLGLLLSVILPNSGDLYLNIVLMGKKFRSLTSGRWHL